MKEHLVLKKYAHKITHYEIVCVCVRARGRVRKISHVDYVQHITHCKSKIYCITMMFDDVRY